MGLSGKVPHTAILWEVRGRQGTASGSPLDRFLKVTLLHTAILWEVSGGAGGPSVGWGWGDRRGMGGGLPTRFPTRPSCGRCVSQGRGALFFSRATTAPLLCARAQVMALMR